MIESEKKKLIVNSDKFNINKKRKKSGKNYIKEIITKKIKESKIFLLFLICTCIFIIASIIISLKFDIIEFRKPIYSPPQLKEILIPVLDSQNISKNNFPILFHNIIPEYNVPNDEDIRCKKYDPFKVTRDRLLETPIKVCQSPKSNHICYKNDISFFVAKEGLICKMQNIVIDPSKWRSDGYDYSLGPSNNKTRGCPLLSKGFFNMECNNFTNITKFNKNYDIYFNSWNYNYIYNKKIPELAEGKTVFFVSRNQDSPNLYFGISGILNAIAMIYYFNLNPENIQIVFLESMKLDNDPLYDLYKYLISRGGEPIHISNLKTKYMVSSAIHVPINWDSPTFMLGSIRGCKYQSKAFHYLNAFIDKYINFKKFVEPIKYDNETFYYPKSVVDPNSPIYKKFLTFQWRKAWPKGRKGQGRLLGNGPEIIEKLSNILPKHILIRLVDTASLKIIDQISLMRKTDYFIGVHGAGLMLSIFMPTTSILHEIYNKKRTDNLYYMSTLSGHKTFVDRFFSKGKFIDGSEYVFFDPNLISKKVLKYINQNEDLFKN